MRNISLLFIFVLFSGLSISQIVETFSTPGSYTWVCPANVTQVRVQCWGGGGGGYNSLSPGYLNPFSMYGGQGGGGGSYSESLLKVIPNNTYYLNVGEGGKGAIGGVSSIAYNGTSSWFYFENKLPINNQGVLATFGLSGKLNQGINKGDALLCIGQIRYSGGNGSDGGNGQNSNYQNSSGSGGSSAGISMNGNNGARRVITVAPLGGGYGGGSENKNGDGGSPGGGGAGSISSPSSNGGNGGDGQVILTYTPNCTTSKTPLVPYTNPSSSCGTFTLSAINAMPVLGLSYQWQKSLDSLQWHNLPNQNNLTYNHSTTESFSYYRLISKCEFSPNDSSTSFVIKHVLNENYLRKGSLIGSQILCKGDKFENVVLKGAKGLLEWEYSTDLISWSKINNFSDTVLSQKIIGDFTGLRHFRVKISSNECGSIYSDTIQIKINELSKAGMLNTSSQTVCQDSELQDILMTNYKGNYISWETSKDSLIWSQISGGETDILAGKLLNTSEKFYLRVVVKNENCTADISDVIRFDIEKKYQGELLKHQNLCRGDMPKALYLSNHKSINFNWQFNTLDSTNNSNWYSIGNNNNFDSINPQILNSLITYLKYGPKKELFIRCIHSQEGACKNIVSNVATITVYSNSFYGKLSSDQSICKGDTPQNMVITNNIGDSITWKYTFDMVKYYPLDSNTTILNGSKISEKDSLVTGNHTWIHIWAFVKNGVCPPSSTFKSIYLSTPPLSGEIIKSGEVCAGEVPNNIELKNYDGSIQWQYRKKSLNNLSGWVNVNMNYSQKNIFNSDILGVIYDTVFVRAVVTKESVCPSVITPIDTIFVSQRSQSGKLTSDQTICQGTFPSDLSITNNLGRINWEKSLDGSNWVSILNETDNILSGSSIGNTYSSTYLRGVVKNGACPSIYTNSIFIAVDSLSQPGILNGEQSICFGSTPGQINTSNFNGSLLWQKSTDSINYNDVPNSNISSLIPGALEVTTYYRVKATNGTCPSKFSSPIKILVSPKSVSGSLIGDQIVCEGSVPPLNLTVMNSVGIINWQVWNSITSSWTPFELHNKAVLFGKDIGPILNSKYFRVLVKSGECPPVSSNSITISTLSKPVVSGGSNRAICPNTSIILTGSGASTYNWDNGVQNGVSFIPNKNNIYSVIGTSANGCRDTASVTISILPQPTVQIINPKSSIICFGSTFNLSSITNNVSSYQWKLNGGYLNGATNNFLSSKSAGNYSLEVQSINGCKAESNPIIIQTQELTFIDAGTNQTICLGDKIKLDATCQTFVDWGKNFKNGDIIFPSKDTLLIASTTDQNGCQNSDTLSVKVNYPNNSILNTTSYGSFDLNGIMYENTGQYTQTLKNSNGCDSTITLNLVVENLGVNENKIKGIKVYPNPTSDGIIQIESDYVLKTIKMYNSDGKLLENINGKSIDLSRFGRGVYFITFLNENNHHFKYKIVY